MRFAAECLLDIYSASSILRLADRPGVQYTIIGLVIISVIGSAYSIYYWIHLTASNPEEGRRAVLDNLRAGADSIKVVADEGRRILNLSA